MRAIKSKGTKLEKLLGKALWKKGYRYRKNNKKKGAVITLNISLIIKVSLNSNKALNSLRMS